MANTVSLLSYANTFGDWVVTTNFLTQQNNNFVANNYVKSTGTLYLNDPTLGLQVANGAIFAGSMQVQGLGSSAFIQNTLSVGGLSTFSNTTQSITTLGPVTAGGQLSATGSNTSLYVANNATVNGILTVSQNTNVTGALTVFGPTSISGVTAVSNTFSTTGAVSFGSTGAFTGTVTAPSFTASTSMATQYLSVSNPAGATVNGSSIITAATYNTYAPSLTGTGASGTWPINITGNAAGSANSATNVTGGSVFAANVTSTGAVSGTTGTFSGQIQQYGDIGVTGAPNIGIRGSSAGALSFYDVKDPDSSIYNYTMKMDGGFITFGYSTTNSAYDYGTTKFTFDSAGNFTAVSNITAYSDERLKKNWKNLSTDFVEQLSKVKNGVYDRIDEDVTQVGVSAQSLQQVMPEAVMEDKEGTLSVAYGNAALAAAVELSKEIIKLRAEIEELKKK